jgi:hypothetical protein
MKKVVIILSLVFIMGCGPNMAAFDEAQSVDATVTNKYVDMSGNKEDGIESHYMVGTDKGVFEVNNSLFMNIWNADELYNKLVVGKKYTITYKGQRVVNLVMQYYPYIVEVEEVVETQ